MYGPAVGRLDQDLVPSVGQLLDVSWCQRGPPLPGVDVLATDGDDTLVMLIAPLATEAGPRGSPALVT